MSVSEIAASQRDIGPCFGFGPGDRLHFLSSVSLSSRGMARRQSAGLDRQAGGGTACGRALGVKRHAPRLAARQRGIFGLRLNQRSGHTRIYPPWQVAPEAARGAGVRKVPVPQVPLPFPALKTPHENALDDGSGCGQLKVNSPIVKSFSRSVKSLLTRCNFLRYETAS